MITHQIPRPVPDRGYPECQCPADCGGRPEIRLRLVPLLPTVREYEAGIRPPAIPHSPTKRGELVYDTLNRRRGIVMDRVRALVSLRPEGGGAEWDVDAKWLVLPQ
jgi:hypothetical protein